MRLLADESLTGRTCQFLRSLGHDVLTLYQLGRAGAKNSEVLTLVRSRHAIVVAEDRGLGSLLTYPIGTHGGLIILKIRSVSNLDAVHRHLRRALKTISHSQLRGSLLIIDRNKYRLRRTS